MFSLFSLHTQLFSNSLHTHTLAHNLSRGVKMTREQSQVQCTLHEDILPLKSQGINFFFFRVLLILLSPAGNRIKGFRSFGERHRMISFENVMNFSKLDFFGSSHLRREETEEELSLLCFFFPANSWIPPLCCLTETPSELFDKLFWVSPSFSLSLLSPSLSQFQFQFQSALLA